MLPTEDDSCMYIRDEKLNYCCDGVGNEPNVLCQHLYATVSQDVEPIKHGDWVESSGKIMKVNNSWFTFKSKSVYNKIIATTDYKLTIELNPVLDAYYRNVLGVLDAENIPQVQQSFLKEFVANPNGEWEVEYKEHKLYAHGPQEFTKLKRNSNNTVNIIFVEEKLYSRAEVEELVYGAMKSRNYTPLIEFNSWIKENL